VFAPFGGMPPNISLVHVKGSGCYMSGQVTYVAGAAECRECRISSWLTVQNDSDLTVSPSITTLYALGMMPIVAGVMVSQNTSPLRAFDNLNKFVTELLIRSYTAS